MPLIIWPDPRMDDKLLIRTVYETSGADIEHPTFNEMCHYVAHPSSMLQEDHGGLLCVIRDSYFVPMPERPTLPLSLGQQLLLQEDHGGTEAGPLLIRLLFDRYPSISVLFMTHRQELASDMRIVPSFLSHALEIIVLRTFPLEKESIEFDEIVQTICKNLARQAKR